nr:hypothetical protein [Tanacetum cinerariifolium]
MMSPGGSIVVSLENINGFLAVNTPPDDLIRIDFEQEGVVPKVMLHIFEEFVLFDCIYWSRGVTVPEHVVIKNPKKSSNKGSKKEKVRLKKLKLIRNHRKVPFKHRTCGKCGEKGHNRRKCTGKKVMEEYEVQEVDGEDEADKEDEIQDVDEDYESDEDNASGEDNSSDASVEVESDDN